VVADVRELVGHHGCPLALVEQVQKAPADHQRGVLGIASCREGVRLRRLDDVEGGRREASADAEVLDRPKEIRLPVTRGAPRASVPQQKR
jgi:hypothetical protein